MSGETTYESVARGPSLPGAITFAALAAALLPAVLLAFGPLVGRWSTLAVYLVIVTCCYSGWLAPSRRAARAGVLSSLLGGAALLAILPGTGTLALSGLVVGCALLISISRSVLYYRARPMRALLLEVSLTLAGLMLAHLLAGSSLISIGAALWGYLLVQSFYCLVPGRRVRAHDGGGADPFERASGRLQALLEEG